MFTLTSNNDCNYNYVGGNDGLDELEIFGINNIRKLHKYRYSKGIQIQAKNNRGTRFINYKLLLRKIRWVSDEETKGNFLEADKYDHIFLDILNRDVNRMDIMYNRDIIQINDTILKLKQLSLIYNGFDFIHVKGYNDIVKYINLINIIRNNNNPGFVNYFNTNSNDNINSFLIWLKLLLECYGKIGRLISYIIWNVIGVIKIIKKRNLKVSNFRIETSVIDCHNILEEYDFYQSIILKQLNKNVQIMSSHVFGIDLHSEYCTRCNEISTQIIKTSCNHLLCWDCIINSNPQDFYKSFKYCPYCFFKLDYNPTSFFYYNKFINLFDEIFKNISMNSNNPILNIFDLEIFIKSINDNTVYVSSDEDDVVNRDDPKDRINYNINCSIDIKNNNPSRIDIVKKNFSNINLDFNLKTKLNYNNKYISNNTGFTHIGRTMKIENENSKMSSSNLSFIYDNSSSSDFMFSNVDKKIDSNYIDICNNDTFSNSDKKNIWNLFELDHLILRKDSKDSDKRGELLISDSNKIDYLDDLE